MRDSILDKNEQFMLSESVKALHRRCDVKDSYPRTLVKALESMEQKLLKSPKPDRLATHGPRMPFAAADKLRAAIMASGKTQAEFAALVGTGQSKVSAFLNGGDIRLSTWEKWANALGFDVIVE